jgi:hypothetical protein
VRDRGGTEGGRGGEGRRGREGRRRQHRGRGRGRRGEERRGDSAESDRGVGSGAVSVTDRPVTRRKSVTFDDKAKVGALVQRARAFKKQKLAEEVEEEALEEQQALARAVSTQQYAVVRCTGSVTGRARTT